MWIPASAAALEQAVNAGDLSEGHSFDAKEALPSPKKNIDLATDIAAMTVDGGVLIYGVGEDENKELTALAPMPLLGTKERIDQIAATSIAEVPSIDVRVLAKDEDPSIGYVVVVVPPSHRAPHQVVVKGDLRFYGRGATGNRILTEGEIARLYAQRQSWERNREALLDQTIAAAPFSDTSDQSGYLHGFLSPVTSDPGLWDRAAGAVGGTSQLMHRLAVAATRLWTRTDYSPSLANGHWDQMGADRYRLGNTSLEAGLTDPDRIAELLFDLNGDTRLYSGRIITTRRVDYGSGGVAFEKAVMEPIMAGNLARAIAATGELYRLAAFHGQVDIGIAVTGLADASSSSFDPFRDHGYNASEYRRTSQLAAGALSDPPAIAQMLLGRLLDSLARGQANSLFTTQQTT
jgi:hypothetical protein